MSCLIVNRILSIIEKKITSQQEHKFIKYGNFLVSGSAGEGLKVGEVNEFDMLVPITILSDHGQCATEVLTRRVFSYIPMGWVEIKKTRGYYISDSKKLHKIIPCSSWNIEPKGILGLFQGVVQKSINDMKLSHFDLKLSVAGPAITLEIMYLPGDGGCERSISVDLVPTIETSYQGTQGKTNELRAVVKKYNTPEQIRYHQHHNPQRLWRESFSKQEKVVMDYLDSKSNGCTSFVLNYFKTLTQLNEKQAPTSAFASKVSSSYFLKTVLIYISLPYKPSKWKWSRIQSMLKEFAMYLQNALSCGKLLHAFLGNQHLQEVFPYVDFYIDQRDEMNLLGGISRDTLKNMEMSMSNCLAMNDMQWMIDSTSIQISSEDTKCCDCPQRYCYSLLKLKRKRPCLCMLLCLLIGFILGILILLLIDQVKQHPYCLFVYS